jgi:F420-non-reducing hydrogenase iron-sulfur subunit
MRTNGAQKILAFTTNAISDPGVDLAGSSHMEYSPTVKVIALPCSSGIDPRWILHAVESGFDGVFIAADGTDCAYLHDCTDRTGKVVQHAQELMREKGQDPRRLKMAAVCSVCAESFVAHVEAFDKTLRKL